MAARKATTRDQAPFGWSAGCGIPAMAVLAGVSYDRVFRELDGIVEAYTRGLPLAREMFGPDVHMTGPMWAGISYGHVNCLGSELIFPKNSEVGHTHVYASLAEGVRALRHDVDFTCAALFPYYLDLWERLKKAFPDQKIGFGGFGAEGPLTTAWSLRGHDFFMDVHDNPPLAREFLRLTTDSVIKYKRLVCRLNGWPEVSPSGAGMADDVSAMISPPMWPDLVLPFHEQYFTGLTTGKRSAHIEDLRVEHLRFLDEIGLDSYDPSVSERLTPALIRDNCRVPFGWRLNETHYVSRTPEQVEQWVFDAVTDGASGVTTHVGRNMCTPETAEKVKAFIRAAKKVERLLAEGCSRERLREHGPRPPRATAQG
jgi:hypothetical protein